MPFSINRDKRSKVLAELKKDPRRSDRDLAEAAGVSQPLVNKVRRLEGFPTAPRGGWRPGAGRKPKNPDDPKHPPKIREKPVERLDRVGPLATLKDVYEHAASIQRQMALGLISQNFGKSLLYGATVLKAIHMVRIEARKAGLDYEASQSKIEVVDNRPLARAEAGQPMPPPKPPRPEQPGASVN
jgi:hypothetical protein